MTNTTKCPQCDGPHTLDHCPRWRLKSNSTITIPMKMAADILGALFWRDTINPEGFEIIKQDFARLMREDPAPDPNYFRKPDGPLAANFNAWADTVSGAKGFFNQHPQQDLHRIIAFVAWEEATRRAAPAIQAQPLTDAARAPGPCVMTDCTELATSYATDLCTAHSAEFKVWQQNKLSGQTGGVA